MKLAIIALLMACTVLAQTATRNVNIAWGASASVEVTGYNVYRCASPCTPATSMTPLNSTPIASTVFVDTTAVVGQTYTYGATPIAPACTPSTLVTTVCGQGPMGATATTTIPVQPSATVAITLMVP